MIVRSYRLPPKYEGRAEDGYTYTAEALPLAAGGVANVPISIETDADFLLEALNGVATDPAAPTVRFLAPAITLNIRSGSSGRLLTDAPVHFVTYVGTAERTFFLPYPKIIKAGSTVMIAFQNLDGAQAYDVRLSLLGTKLFPFSADMIE